METKTLQLNVKQQNNLFYTFPPLIFTWILLIKYIPIPKPINIIDIVCFRLNANVKFHQNNTFQFMDFKRREKFCTLLQRSIFIQKVSAKNPHFCCISLLCTVCNWHTGALWGSKTLLAYTSYQRFIKKKDCNK